MWLIFCLLGSKSLLYEQVSFKQKFGWISTNNLTLPCSLYGRKLTATLHWEKWGKTVDWFPFGIDERCELLFSRRVSLHVIQVSHFRSNSIFIFNKNLSKMSVCVDNLKIARWDVVEGSTAHQSWTLMLHPWKQSGTNKLVVDMCKSIYIYTKIFLPGYG